MPSATPPGAGPCSPATNPEAGGAAAGAPIAPARPNIPAPHARLHDATHDPSVIAAWWQRWPTANVAVRTGAASGLVVLDVDPDHGGLASLAELQRTHGRLPPSPAVRTGSGGRHYWFTHPGNHVRNSAGLLGPGLDIRGDGGYVIAPQHPRHRKSLCLGVGSRPGPGAGLAPGAVPGTAPDRCATSFQPVPTSAGRALGSGRVRDRARPAAPDPRRLQKSHAEPSGICPRASSWAPVISTATSSATP